MWIGCRRRDCPGPSPFDSRYMMPGYRHCFKTEAAGCYRAGVHSDANLGRSMFGNLSHRRATPSMVINRRSVSWKASICVLPCWKTSVYGVDGIFPPELLGYFAVSGLMPHGAEGCIIQGLHVCKREPPCNEDRRPMSS